MAKENYGFKFGIGEIVTTVASKLCDIGEVDGKVKLKNIRPTLQIVERTLQECPGGVQRHYLCRPHHVTMVGFGHIEMAFGTANVLLNEVELEVFPKKK